MHCVPIVGSCPQGRWSSRVGRWAAAAVWVLTGCTVARVDGVPAGHYQVKAAATAPPTVAQDAATAPRRRLYLEQPTADSLLFYPPGPVPQSPLQLGRGQLTGIQLRHSEFDFDIFTLPFKVRESREGVPTQLNTTFNAAVYLGRRLDVYRFQQRVLPSGRAVTRIQTAGFGYGIFGGLGSAVVTPDLTRQHANTEYEGFVLHSGVAGIYDARALNVGLAVGFDRLLGADGPYWLYQNRPWLGVLFGLNLN